MTDVIKFKGPAGIYYHSFQESCDKYAENFPAFFQNDWKPNAANPRRAYMFPPIFRYAFTQPAILAGEPFEPSGSLEKLKEGTRHNLIGAISEHRVFETLEKFFYGRQVALVISQFKIDDRKLKILKLIFPDFKELKGMETDFIVFTAKQIFVIEVKGCDKEIKATNETNRAEKLARNIKENYKVAIGQLAAAEKTLKSVMNYFNLPTIPIAKLVVMPDIEFDEIDDFIGGFDWQNLLIAKLELAESNDDTLCNARLELAKKIVGLFVLENFSQTESIISLRDLSTSSVVVEESQNIFQQRVLNPVEGKLESEMKRTTKVIINEEEKLTLHDVLNVFFLTPEQMVVWQTKNKRQILAGAAGTGKTLLCIGRALALNFEKQKVLFLATPAMQNRMKEHLGKNAKSNHIQIMDAGMFLELPGVKKLSEIFRSIYDNLHNYVKTILLQKKDSTIQTCLKFDSEKVPTPDRAYEEYENRRLHLLRSITDVLADTFRELSEVRDVRDREHSISYPTGKQGAVLKIFLKFCVSESMYTEAEAAINQLKDFMADKHVIVDDLLSLSDIYSIP